MGEEKCAILTTDVNQQKKIGDFLFCKKVRKRPGAKQEKFEDCVIDMKSFICLEAIQNVKLSMSKNLIVIDFQIVAPVVCFITEVWSNSYRWSERYLVKTPFLTIGLSSNFSTKK